MEDIDKVSKAGIRKNEKHQLRIKTRKNKILDFTELSQLKTSKPGQKIALCHGVFDVLHAGHLAYFESAKQHADILVVTVTSDQFVNKGPGRPYFNTSIRTNMLAGLEVVDYVAVSSSPTAVKVIEALRPDFYIKGPDYQNKSLDQTGGIYLEEQAVEKNGGKLVFTSDDTYSSSKLLNEYFQTWSEAQQNYIAKVKNIGGLEKVEEILDQLRKEEVQIIGEPIIDTYIFCLPESISSKSPSISAKYLFEEHYAGGSLAIANHLSDFMKEVSLVTTFGSEDLTKSILKENLDKRVQLSSIELNGIPTPQKTRFIVEDNKQRMFEITNLRSDQWNTHSPQEFCSLLQKRAKFSGTTIVADFGHGLFEGNVLESLTEFKGFVGINVQTNSSNFGFNPFKKHKRFNYLSIDLKEARIAYHDRYTSHFGLAEKIKRDFSGKMAFSMTLGSTGSFFSPSNGSEDYMCPAFADKVIDATGAGDAYFALTTALSKINCPDLLIPFIGNVFAGLKTKIIGNKHPVTRAQLVKAITAILK